MKYEKKATFKYFRVLESKCYILKDRKNTHKFKSKCDEAIFLGYSSNSRAYMVYNPRTTTVMKSINVVVDGMSTKIVSKELKELEFGNVSESDDDHEHTPPR